MSMFSTTKNSFQHDVRVVFVQFSYKSSAVKVMCYWMNWCFKAKLQAVVVKKRSLFSC